MRQRSVAEWLRRKGHRSEVEGLENRLLLAAQAYDWNSVTIKGNGFIDGIVYSPAAPNLAYIHTDMGGAYRWDQSASRWMPLTDWIQATDWSVNYNGAETLAVDPTDPNRVYLGLGTYMGDSAVLRSTDQGRTWLRTNVGFRMNGNGSARNTGERMNVDPNSPNILYYGTREDGLWKSTNYGATWNRVTAFPTAGQDGGVEADTGIVWTLFDKSSGTPGSPTPTIYVGVVQYDAGLDRIYRSTDGGATWAAIPGGQPTTLNYFPQRAALTPDGNTLYLTYGYSTDYPGPWGISEGMVYKVANPDAASPTWTDVSPNVTYGFSAVAIDPTDPNTVFVSELGNYNPADRIWRSINGGSSWTAITPSSFRDDASAPYASSLGVHWLGDLQIDPFNRNVAMFTTGYGLYRTTNLTATQPTWSFFNDGFEQTAVLELSSPNTGTVHLISAIGDRDGYRHDDFSQSPSIGRLGQRNGLARGTSPDLDTAFNDANYVVRVVGSSPYVQYSINNGIDWAWMPSNGMIGGSNGNIAMSADGTKVVYEPGDTGQVIYSTRSGSTWSNWSAPSSNRPADGAKITADLGSTQTFYAYVGTTLSRSTDGGATWTVMTTSAPSGASWIRALPGQAGHLVMGRGYNGLWRSTNGGANWAQLANGVVTAANEVGVGMGPTVGSYPSIFIGGTVGGQNGFFRSDDQGATWTMISDLAHQYGDVIVIQGDPRVYGRLYVGTNGRGILYADIHTPPTSLPSGWSTTDIGSVGSSGAAGSPSTGNWELTGGGAGITGTADAFRFAYTTLTDDGTITARVLGVPNSSPANHNALAGVMIRNDLTAGSANVLMAMSPGSVNGAVFKYRTTAGGSSNTANAAGVWNPYWVRLTRVGNLFTAYRSADGVTWTEVGTAQTITMGTSVYIGLAVTAADNNQLNISTFDNVDVQVSQGITGSLVAAPDVTWRDLGKKSYDFVVQYSSSALLDAGSVDGDEITVTGPTGLLSVTLLSMSISPNGKSIDATYRLTPPGGRWSTDDNGTYTIAAVAGTVADVEENTNAAANLGPIPVTLPGAGAIAVLVPGTPNADVLTVTLTATGYTVGINGMSMSYAGNNVRSILVYGYAGHDRITITGEVYICEVSAGAGNDTIAGGSGDDLIRGDEDNDEITGNLGEDTLYGNFGNDSITGAEGADSLMGGLGADTIDGGLLDDSIYGGDQMDLIYGREGADYIEGRGKADTIWGGAGNDTILGGAGSDSIVAEDGDDWIYVGLHLAFADTVDGGAGSDTSDGDANDELTSIENVLA